MKTNQAKSGATAPSVASEETKPATLKVVSINPLEQRTIKIAELQRKTFHLHTLRDKDRELSQFMLETDKTSDRLEIRDSEGHSFQLSNTKIIAIVVQTLREQFSLKAAELELEIMEASL